MDTHSIIMEYIYIYILVKSDWLDIFMACDVIFNKFFFIFQYNKFITVNCFILSNSIMTEEIQLGILKCCM